MADRIILACTLIIAVVYLYAATQIPVLSIGDPLWPMPLWAPYESGLSSTVADQPGQDLVELRERAERGLPDARLACAPTGCVGSDNPPSNCTAPVSETARFAHCGVSGLALVPAGSDSRKRESFATQLAKRCRSTGFR